MTAAYSPSRATWVACVVLGTAMATVSRPVLAQDAPVATRLDSILRQAQRHAGDGDLFGARAIVDSFIGTTVEGSPEFVEALFWRATFAASVEGARRDYLRIALEYSLAPRAEDALLRLAQSELARGDRAAARRHLDQLALEHAEGRLRAEREYWAGRLWLAENALPQACAALGESRSHLNGGDVELANQIAYFQRQCEGVTTADGRRLTSDSASKVGLVAQADSAPATTPSRRGNNPVGNQRGWSAQVAAYSARTDAERVAQKLNARGLEARVTAESPFRVRVGHFAKREEAVAMATKLRRQKMTAIVVEIERP